MTTHIRDNAILTFALSSALFNFAVSFQNETLYPRDRIFNLIFSMVINFSIIYLLRYIDLKKNGLNIAVYIFILYKIILNTIKFSKYFSAFHGSNADIIIFFTALLILGCLKLSESNITQMYSFFIFINLIIFIIITTLSLDKINAINIYSTQLNIMVTPSKFIFFDEIIIMSLLFSDSKEKVKYQLSFLFTIFTIMVFYTLLQGFCIKGNILYSISPLQALMQIFSGTTIKRFDYIISVLQSFNYYAAVIFLMWGFNFLRGKQEALCDEKV